MACQCYGFENTDTSEVGSVATFEYTDCITGEIIGPINIPQFQTVYFCSEDYPQVLSGSVLEGIVNGSYCDNKCYCKCFSVENTGTAFGYFNYVSCITGDFTFPETQIGYPGSGEPTQLYFCVQSNGPGDPYPGIIDASSQEANLVFTPQNDFFNCGDCNISYSCYSWTVTIEEPIPSTLLISYTNTDGDFIDQVEVLTNILYVTNLDDTLTYYLCSSTEPEFFEGSPVPDPVVPPFTVETGGTCESDLECNPSIPYTVYLVSDCCDDKPDGYMYLPVGLLPNQVVGSSTDNTCYKIVEGAEATENLDWNGTVYPVGGCNDCQEANEYFCDPEPLTPTPTKTQTPTPTPQTTLTPTPTPTLTPTPTYKPKTIYFQKCCKIDQYLGILNYKGTIISQNLYLSITIGANTFCVKRVRSAPSTVVLYDYDSIDLISYDSCEDCLIEHPCTPPPTQQIMGYRNECNVITIFPMNLECVSTSPSTIESNDGLVSVSITGGTPPYKYTWEGIGIGNDSHAPAIENVPIGDYTVTVVDYWGDFTATTTCTLTAKTDCNFVGTIKLFTPPTPTPTMTMTPTPSSIPSRCDCRYGNVYISQDDCDAGDGFVYVSYQDCNGICYCLTTEGNNAIPYTSGTSLNDICVDVTTTTGVGVSLFILVEGDYELLPINGDSYVTLGGCCTTPIP